MGFNTSYIVNDKLKTTESIGSSFFTTTRVDVFTPGLNFEVVDYSEPVIIDAIDWFPRNETHAKIIIEVKGGGNVLINPLGNGTLSEVSPKDVLDGMSLYWEVIKYDTTTTPDPVIRFHLKEPIYCPRGVKITLRNTDETLSFRNSCQIRGRVMS